ncbi:MAG: polyprenol monophosphomannose synthase [Planctomycetaceae bacterium]
MPHLLITVCTYNELDNIRLLIPQLREVAPQADVLILDDNSPDGTGQAADEFAAQDDHVRVIHRPFKLGIGAATLAGFRYGIQHDYELLLNLDADFSHHPRHIPALLDCVKTCDVSIGSRYVPGGGISGWSWTRHVMSRGVNVYSRLLLGLKTRDCSGSFRCYRVAKLAEIDWDQTLAMGYAFEEEVLYRCRQVGCTFQETPIHFEDRRLGRTKISGREVMIAIWMILRLGIQRLTGGKKNSPRGRS